jgi:hypothetical protein
MTCNKFEEQVKGVTEGSSITAGGHVGPRRGAGKSTRVCLCFRM